MFALSGPGTAHGTQLHIITNKTKTVSYEAPQDVLCGNHLHWRSNEVTHNYGCKQACNYKQKPRRRMAIGDSMVQADGCYTTHCWQHSGKHKQPPAVWFAFMWLSSLRTLGAEIKTHTHRQKKKVTNHHRLCWESLNSIYRLIALEIHKMYIMFEYWRIQVKAKLIQC